jgi:hypothetical protein
MSIVFAIFGGIASILLHFVLGRNVVLNSDILAIFGRLASKLLHFVLVGKGS